MKIAHLRERGEEEDLVAPRTALVARSISEKEEEEEDKERGE